MREDPCVPVDDDDDALGSAFRVFLPVSKWFCSDMVEGDDEDSREEILSLEGKIAIFHSLSVVVRRRRDVRAVLPGPSLILSLVDVPMNGMGEREWGNERGRLTGDHHPPTIIRV